MARLLLDAGVFLYVGPGPRANRHAHHAVQLVWSPAGTCTLSLRGRTITARAVLVPSHEPHALDATGTTIALLLVEAHGPRGLALDAYARTAAGTDLAAALAALPFPTAPPADLPRWCDDVIAALGLTVPPRPAISSVARRTIAYVEAALDGRPSLAAAAARVGVSPTRLTHVFTREVGIPFRRFVLWARLARAVDAARRGADLGTAAAEAGFSDAAHLSRTFRAMFGLPPSAILAAAPIAGARAPRPLRSSRPPRAAPR